MRTGDESYHGGGNSGDTTNLGCVDDGLRSLSEVHRQQPFRPSAGWLPSRLNLHIKCAPLSAVWCVAVNLLMVSIVCASMVIS